ncbi:hypothetical protein B9T07_14180 [Limnospira fusiformis CCALA 023]
MRAIAQGDRCHITYSNQASTGVSASPQRFCPKIGFRGTIAVNRNSQPYFSRQYNHEQSRNHCHI